MENARLAVFEDEDFWQNAFKMMAERGGHTVTETATSFADARVISEKIVSGEVEVDLVLLDGNIGPYAYGEDAKKIMHILGFPEDPVVAVAGMSSDSFSSYGLRPTFDIGKFNARDLNDYIAKL